MSMIHVLQCNFSRRLLDSGVEQISVKKIEMMSFFPFRAVQKNSTLKSGYEENRNKFDSPTCYWSLSFQVS